MAVTHFSGPVAVGKDSVVTLSADYTVVPNDNGTTFILNDAAGHDITLPAQSEDRAGMRFKFIIGATFATTDWTITSAEISTIYGTVQEAGAQQTFGGDSTMNFELAAESIGDYVELISDGTNWYVTGMTALAASITPG